MYNLGIKTIKILCYYLKTPKAQEIGKIFFMPYNTDRHTHTALYF